MNENQVGAAVHRWIVMSMVLMAAALFLGAAGTAGAADPSVRAASSSSRLPKAALDYAIFRSPRTATQVPNQEEMDALQNIQGGWHDPSWRALYTPIGGPILAQARRVPNPGFDVIAVPGRTGMAVVLVENGLIRLCSGAYDDIAAGSVTCFSRACTQWASNGIDCDATDGGMLTVYFPVPDTVRSVVLNGRRVTAVGNTVVGNVGPLADTTKLIASMDEYRARVRDLAAKRAAAERKRQKALAKKARKKTRAREMPKAERKAKAKKKHETKR